MKQIFRKENRKKTIIKCYQLKREKKEEKDHDKMTESQILKLLKEKYKI